MSFKSATARISLLAGSSMIVASLSAAASIGLTLAPTAAWAIDECAPVPSSGTSTDGAGGASDPTLNGATADRFQCAAGTYANGVSYSADGDLSVGTIASGATVNTTVTNNGVNLTATGTDSVTWDSTVGSVVGGAGTAGPVIDVTTVSGAINITTGVVTATQAGTTHGIRATSTGGGNITISRAAGAVNDGMAGGVAAIEAVTNGGNITILNTSTIGTTGRLRGILAQTSGAGSINIDVSGAVTANATDGIAAIDVIAATGGISITNRGGSMTGGAGAAIRAVSASAVNVQNTGGTVNGRVDFSGVTAGGVTFNNAGTTNQSGVWTASGASVFSGLADTLTIGGVTPNSTMAAGGSINLGAGADTFNLGSTFTTAAGTIDFGTGADLFNVTGSLVANGTAINFGADADTMNLSGVLTATGATLDFGAGADTFNQSGALLWNGVTAVSNLEAFNNSGVIYLGGARSFAGVDNTDGAANDVLNVTSGVFTGSGASRIVIDANLGTSGSQIGCASPTVADCVNFTGAATAGSTLLTVHDISFSVDGGTLDTVITLVQGSTAAEHFSLDPNSDYYASTPQGPAIRKPVVAYKLIYDDVNHRHVLVGAPTDEVLQVATFAATAQEAWRATTGSWLTRQADLRATPGGLEASRGVWGRVGAQAGERDVAASYEVAGLTFDYDLGHKQKIAHLTFGADLLGGAGADSAWVVGGMVGFVRGDVEYQGAPTEATSTGYSGGLYASYLAGPLFIDGVLNVNLMHIKADAPQMGLGLDVPMTFDQKSLGGQLEAGWRIGSGSGVFVEPLVGVSYVGTKFDDTVVPGGSGAFDFDDKYTSLRLGGGARVGMDSQLLGMTASYSLTGRYWNDSEGETSLTVVTANGSSALLADDFGGGFSEVAGSVNLYSDGGGVSGFVNLGGKFADGYHAVDGSAGVRVRW